MQSFSHRSNKSTEEIASNDESGSDSSENTENPEVQQIKLRQYIASCRSSDIHNLDKASNNKKDDSKQGERQRSPLKNINLNMVVQSSSRAQKSELTEVNVSP